MIITIKHITNEGHHPAEGHAESAGEGGRGGRGDLRQDGVLVRDQRQGEDQVRLRRRGAHRGPHDEDRGAHSGGVRFKVSVALIVCC